MAADAKEKIPTLTEVIGRGEAETVKKARNKFRTSLVVGMEDVLGYENLAKLESWFIKKALEGYRATMSSEIYLETWLTILNASAWLTGLDLYEKSMLRVSEAATGWHERRAEATMVKLEWEIESARRMIEKYPEKLERLRQFNEKTANVVDKWIRPVTNGVGEGLGAAAGFAVMMLGVTGGMVGYAGGRVARAAVEVIMKKIRTYVD